MPPDPVRSYLLHGLAATPVVIDRLLRDAAPGDYDRRPDPERFTLREVLAHLADWEPIWLARLEKIRAEAQPALPSYDEGRPAIDRDYAHADPARQQARFCEGRARLLHFLEELAPDDWERTGRHSQWGDLSVLALAVLVLGHDGYHMRQIAEWLSHPARGSRAK
jgi:uncharacterized damage-inducible protein DinB